MKRLSKILAMLFLATVATAPAAATSLTRPITSFTLTLMPPGKGQKPFGWIELLDAAGKPSGYIYLENANDDDPHVGGSGTYVVTRLPYDQLGAMIAILQTVKPLQIRFEDAGTQPTVFIESVSGTSVSLEISNAAKLRKPM